MSLDNSIYLAEAARRLGIKGSESTFGIVPGIFPVVVLRDIGDLVAAPREARAVAGLRLSLLAAQVREYRLVAPGDFVLHEIWFESDQADTPLMMNSRATLGGVATVNKEELGDHATQGDLTVITVPIVQGAMIAQGEAHLTGLDWYFGGNKTCSLIVGPSGLNYTFTLAVTWKELPQAAIAP